MAAPMVRAIRSQRPDWTLHAITALQSTYGYVSALGDLNRAECEEFLNYPATRKFQKLMRLRARSYDFVLLPYPAARWQYHLGALTMAGGSLVAHRYWSAQQFAPGYQYQAPVEPMHVVDLNAQLLEGLGLSTHIDRSYVFPGLWQLDQAVSRRRIAFHLVSLSSEINKGNYHKSPPLEMYAEVARRFHSEGFEICAVGAGNERSVADAFALICGFPVEFVTGSLRESARRLRECSILIASESGIAHLAAAVRVPVVCAFGMTDPLRFAPLGDVQIVRPSKCKPCYDPSDRRFTCKLDSDFSCIKQDMKAEHLIAAVQHRLNAGESDPVLVPVG